MTRHAAHTSPARPALACSMALFIAALAAACGDGGQQGDAVMQSEDGTFVVRHQADARWKGDVAQQEMEAVLERLPKIDLIYAHNDPMAKGAAQACRQKGRTDVRIIGVDGLPGDGHGQQLVRDGVIDATFAYPTCGAEAIDLALLACSGIDVPKRIELGTVEYTKAAIAAGGRRVTSPGEFMLANLRQQHGDVLTTEPMTDVVFRIGMAQCTDDEPWRVQMGKDLEAAAARYPQIEYHYRSANDDVETQRGIVRDFIAQNFNAILISPKESRSLAAACQEAVAAGIKVIVIDRELGGEDGGFTCFIGGDNVAIGRAAGAHARTLLPAGGVIVELQGLMTSSPAQERHAGFAEALGLK